LTSVITPDAQAGFADGQIAIANVGNTAPGGSPAGNRQNFFEFSVTPATGFELDLATLTFATIRADGATQLEIVASTNNFVTETSVATITGIAGTDDRSFTLTGLNDITTTTTFRLFVSDGPGFGRLGLTDNSVTGDVRLEGNVTAVVPEPSTLGLAATVGVAALARRRRRQG
jgi:hypothetical protein